MLFRANELRAGAFPTIGVIVSEAVNHAKSKGCSQLETVSYA